MLLKKRDLAIHTEMFTDGMVDLFEAGCIAKTPHSFGNETFTGKMVGAFALGTRRLYDFLHRNPAVALMRGSWVNDPHVIARNRKQISINTALEVDLTGQVCSESIGPRQFSGTGGQSDTAIGAQMSDGGKSFIALYSTTSVKQPDGTRKSVSKIVPTLTPGAAVTLHRSDVDYVVTEFGAVRLKGAPVRERVRRLISIAHPDFRDALREEAGRLQLSGDPESGVGPQSERALWFGRRIGFLSAPADHHGAPYVADASGDRHHQVAVLQSSLLQAFMQRNHEIDLAGMAVVLLEQPPASAQT